MRHQATRGRDPHPVPAQPGRPARYDYEYERNGTASLFMLFAPLEGWREVKVTERRTAIDYAQVLKELSDIHFADADKIVLVQDNLVRMALHAQARQLAQYGRIRARHSVQPMSRQAHRRPADP
jgi:DDE superfamily endonuclease